MIVWLDGRLSDEHVARVSPLDHGLVVGDGVFETLRVHRGVPFAWRRHLERLAVSAAAMRLRIPDEAVLRDAAASVLAANGLTEARLRLTVTSGPAPPGSRRGTAAPTVIVVAAPIEPIEALTDVVSLPWTVNERGPLAGIKTVSYAASVRALLHAHEHGAHDGVFTDTRGRLCEATTANVFLVRDRGVRTPALDTGCLPGVTRALVLEACTRLRIAAEESTLTIDDLRDADEAFLTSSVAVVRSIRRVDGVALRAAPGPTTSMLANALATLMDEQPDP